MYPHIGPEGAEGTLLRLKAQLFGHIAASSSLHKRHGARSRLGDKGRDHPGAAAAFDRETREATEAALGMLSLGEKDYVILQMQREMVELRARAQEVVDFSEATLAELASAQERAAQEQTETEERLQSELDRWRHHHPKVEELLGDVHKLRQEEDRNRRQLLALARKLARSRARERELEEEGFYDVATRKEAERREESRILIQEAEERRRQRRNARAARSGGVSSMGDEDSN